MIAEAVQLSGRNDPGANIPQLVSSWLSDVRNGRWVMVLDSADDQDVFYNTGGSGATAPDDGRPLADYLPQSDNGSILVTTRDGGLAFKMTGDRRNMLNIGPMAEEDAVLLLEKRLGPLAGRDAATELVRALDLIPLAISQAAGYIQRRAPRTSVEKYLAEFKTGERKRIRLLGHEAGDLRSGGGASNSVLTTWTLSFERIRSERSSAADLLSIMSFFDPQAIPEEVLKPSLQLLSCGSEDSEGGGEGEDDEFEDHEVREDEFGDEFKDDEFEDDVALLRDYSLISVGGTGAGDTFAMHALVQLATWRWLESRGLQTAFKERYVRLLRSAFSARAEDKNSWAARERLFPHVEAAVELRPESVEAGKAWARLLKDGGLHALVQGRFSSAERLLREARGAHEQIFSEDAEETLKTTSAWALVLGYVGRPVEAERVQMRTLDTIWGNFGPQHDLSLFSMSCLADLYFHQGRWEESESLGLRILEAQKGKHGADHSVTMVTTINLARTYIRQSRLEEAEQLNAMALEFYKRHPDPNHTDAVLTARIRLAHVRCLQGRLEEAREMSLEALETSKTAFGIGHPVTLKAMAVVAQVLHSMGRFGEASEIRVEVLERRKTRPGPDSHITLESMHDLAVSWAALGQHTDAADLMRTCVQHRREVLGLGHPDTASSSALLAEWGG